MHASVTTVDALEMKNKILLVSITENIIAYFKYSRSMQAEHRSNRKTHLAKQIYWIPKKKNHYSLDCSTCAGVCVQPLVYCNISLPLGG